MILTLAMLALLAQEGPAAPAEKKADRVENKGGRMEKLREALRNPAFRERLKALRERREKKGDREPRRSGGKTTASDPQE